MTPFPSLRRSPPFGADPPSRSRRNQQVENLTILDEATTRVVEVGGVRLRLLGLGGAVVVAKMFDNGEGSATIAGGGGTMWTTALQMGELLDTAQRVSPASMEGGGRRWRREPRGAFHSRVSSTFSPPASSRMRTDLEGLLHRSTIHPRLDFSSPTHP